MDYLQALDQKLFSGKTKNGINYFILPMKNFNFKSAAIAVNYGAKDIYENSPYGTAHFIEHKLFENEDGNAFDDFVKNNAEANAYTDFNKTVYYFNTAGDFYKNLEVLTGFVSKPYFEEESIEREKGIIKQEIAMYGDDAYWQTYFDCIGKMYPEGELKEIAGTKESVAEINKDILYKCYDNFYRAENISIVCAGEVDRDRIIEITGKMDIKKGRISPKKKVFKTGGGEETKRQMELQIPAFTLGFPLNYDERCNTLWFKYRIKVLMDIIAGNASRVYNNLYNSGDVKEPFGFDFVSGEGYSFIVFTGKTKEYEKSARLIREFMLMTKESGIGERDFENCHRKACGRFVRGFNSISAVCMAQAEICHMGNIVEAYEEVSKMTKFELDMILRKYIDIEKYVLSVAE